MYAEEFVHAYERQIAEYKRLGSADEHLKETVVMKESDLVTDSVNQALDDDSSVEDALENSIIEAAATLDPFKETVAFDDLSLDDLPDEEPADQAKG